MSGKEKLSANEERVLVELAKSRDRGEPGISADALAERTGLTHDEVKRALVGLREKNYASGPPSLAEQAVALLKEVEPDVAPSTSHYSEHVLLCAALVSDIADEKKLAAELAFDQEFVSAIAARMRAAGFWTHENVSPAHRALIEKSSLNYGIAMAVALGDLQVVGGTPDNPRFQMTKSGMEKAARIVKGRK